MEHNDQKPLEIPDVKHLPRKHANDLKTNYIMTYGQDTLCLPKETTSSGKPKPKGVINPEGKREPEDGPKSHGLEREKGYSQDI